MDDRDPSTADRPDPAVVQTVPTTAVTLPPVPFADPTAPSDRPRMVALSPRVLVLLAAFLVLGVLAWMARDSIRPFVVGLLLVYLLDPPVRWLAGRGVPRPLAIAIVYVVAVVAIVEFLNLTLTPLIDELVRFFDDLPQLATQLQDQLQRLTELYSRIQLPEAIREWTDSLIDGLAEGGAGSFDPSILLGVLTGATNFLGGLFGYLLLPVWVFFLLKDRVSLTRAFDRAMPATWRFDVWAVVRITQRVFGQWVRGQLILGVTVGIFTFAGLILLSVTVDPVFGRYAVLLSITAGILELLPIIGPIIAAVPAVLLAATAGVEAVVAALVLYTLVQQVENNLLVPKIQGDAVELHPAAVIVAIVVGGALAGLLGAILALPIAAASRDVVRYLFRRLSPDSQEPLLASLEGLKVPGLTRDDVTEPPDKEPVAVP
jgi:predicted PurR-regulated permease PerM